MNTHPTSNDKQPNVFACFRAVVRLLRLVGLVEPRLLMPAVAADASEVRRHPSPETVHQQTGLWVAHVNSLFAALHSAFDWANKLVKRCGSCGIFKYKKATTKSNQHTETRLRFVDLPSSPFPSQFSLPSPPRFPLCFPIPVSLLCFTCLV